jgi:hypothetical protein
MCGFSYSQSKKFNCYCPPKKVIHHNKYVVKKKVIPKVITKEPCVIVCPPQKVEIKTIETKVIETRVEKEIIVKYIEPPVLKTNGPILELYTGYVEAKDDALKFSALIGANLYLDLFQAQRQGNQQRVYANRLLLGFEHSALISNDMIFTDLHPGTAPPVEDCNCTTESITPTEEGTQTFIFKHKVRAVSLNTGIEVYKGWYLLTGITNYQHILTLNTQEYSEYRTMYIDAGLQKVIQYNRWFFIPKFKFNPETMTFGIGVSYR